MLLLLLLLLLFCIASVHIDWPVFCFGVVDREVFIADTGTAVTALALCVKLQPDASKLVVYRKAMERYATFVTGGCSTPPTDPHVTNITGATGCPPIDGQGWVITNGVDKGALGDGWYKQELNSGAYTISTATTGSCAFVEMDQVYSIHLLISLLCRCCRTCNCLLRARCQCLFL